MLIGDERLLLWVFELNHFLATVIHAEVVEFVLKGGVLDQELAERRPEMRNDIGLFLFQDLNEEILVKLSHELKLDFYLLDDLLNPRGFNVNWFVLI